jgi:hypothetical protein
VVLRGDGVGKALPQRIFHPAENATPFEQTEAADNRASRDGRESR